MHLFGILYSTRSTEIMIASSVYEVQGENHALNIMSVEQHYSKTQLFFLLLSCSCIFKLFSLAPDHQFAKGCLQFFFPHKVYNKETSENTCGLFKLAPSHLHLLSQYRSFSNL